MQSRDDLTFKDLFFPFTTKKAIIFIILIGFIIFANSLFNGFLLDDNVQIIRNPNVHSISKIFTLFINQEGGQETMSYYRPLPLIIFNFIYTFFKESSFFYHFTQVLLYIANCVLVFLLFKKFLNSKISFLLSLLFLVHPISEEIAVYIANLQDVLYMFFGLIALNFAWNRAKTMSSIVLINIFLLFSILSKETGVLFFIIVFLFISLFKRGLLIKHVITSYTIAFIYLVLRVISGTPFQKTAVMPITDLSFWQRFLNIPAIVFYYVKTFFYPKELVVFHSWVIKNITFTNFLVPLFIDVLLLVIIIFLFTQIKKKAQETKLTVFFLIWFLIGIIAHSQLILLDSTVADRFFYFPIVGLLAFVGIYIKHIKLSKNVAKTLLLVYILSLCILSVRTIIRNSDWKDQSTILLHDERIAGNDYLLELLYGNNLIKQGKITFSTSHIKKAINLYPKSPSAWTSLGVIYLNNSQINDAEKTFRYAISLEDDYFAAYENLGFLLEKHKDPVASVKFLRTATKKFPNSWKLWYYRFIVEYKLGNADFALTSAKNYYLLNPNQQSYLIYTHLLQKLPIKFE
jgi:protein O-mannosyl-transferase